jgi:TonB family protein
VAATATAVTSPAPPASLAGVETADLRDERGAVRRGVRAQRRTWAWLALASVVGIAAATGTYFGEEPPAATHRAPYPVGPATFRVETEPAGARVWVDEAEVGVAPIALAVAGGRHKVRVAVDGYAPAELSLDIAAGTAPPPLRFSLEPVMALLTVTSTPAGATVRVDGKTIGTAPIDSAVVPPGRHDLRVEKRGYAPSVRRIDAVAGETIDVRARLTRLAAEGEALPLTPDVEPPLAPGTLVPIDGTVSPPRKISGSAPPYPDEARRVNLVGSVKVEMIVDENGQPTDLRVVGSAGEILDRAVVNAVRSWRFEPATKAGVKVKVRWSHTQTYVRE